MEFGLTAEQQALRDSVGRFAEEVLAPRYRERDLRRAIEPETVRSLGDLGFLGVELPECFGGLGLDHVTSGIIVEEIAAGDFNVAYVPLLASLCGQIIAHHALPEVAAEWLPRILRGEAVAALALTEPQGGSDAAALRLRADRDARGYTLSGEKTSISMADQAAVAVVFARTGTPAQRAAGISAFLVPLDQPGISRTRFDDVGEKAIGRGALFFDRVRVAENHRLGKEGAGFRQVMQGFDFSRALIGLQCLAVARQSLRETWEYVSGRRAFGQPLSAFQGLSHPLAELQTQVEAARLLCYNALWLKDQGQAHAAEAAMCKWWAPQLSFDVMHRCLLAHGHAGYSEELPFAQRLRDVLGLQIGDGTAQVMKSIVARHYAGRENVPF